MLYHKKYYSSQYVASDIAFWLEADIKQLDTHVHCDLYAIYKRDSNHNEVRSTFSKNYIISFDSFYEMIKRGAIAKINLTSKGNFSEYKLQKINQMLEFKSVFASIPLSEESIHEYNQNTIVNDNIWYELIILSFKSEVIFDFNINGYKYEIKNISLLKNPFYLLSDRLGAKIRFVAEWTQVDDLLNKLAYASQNNKKLNSIEEDLRNVIERLKQDSNTDAHFLSICSDLLRSIEKLLRSLLSNGSNKTLDVLNRLCFEKNLISDETNQLILLIVKPYRDFIQHGRSFKPSVSKVLIATCIEIMMSLR